MKTTVQKWLGSRAATAGQHLPCQYRYPSAAHTQVRLFTVSRCVSPGVHNTHTGRDLLHRQICKDFLSQNLSMPTITPCCKQHKLTSPAQSHMNHNSLGYGASKLWNHQPGASVQVSTNLFKPYSEFPPGVPVGHTQDPCGHTYAHTSHHAQPNIVGLQVDRVTVAPSAPATCTRAAAWLRVNNLQQSLPTLPRIPLLMCTRHITGSQNIVSPTNIH